MTAVRKAGILTDIRKIKAGKQQVVLHFGNTDKFDVVLAGLPVQLPETGCKIGIAHTAAVCQIFDHQRFVGMFINIFHNGIKGIDIGGRQSYLVRIKTVFAPDAENLYEQRGDYGLKADIITVILMANLLNAGMKFLCNRIVIQQVGRKVHRSSLFIDRTFKDTAKMRGIAAVNMQVVNIKFQDGVNQLILRGIYGMHRLRMKENHVAGAYKILRTVAGDQTGSGFHIDQLHEIMPVCFDRKAVMTCIIEKCLIRRIQCILLFHQYIHGTPPTVD